MPELKRLGWLGWIALVLLITPLAVHMTYMVGFYRDNADSSTTKVSTAILDRAAKLGDSSNVLTAGTSLLALILLALTYRTQREELAQSRREFEKQGEIFANDARMNALRSAATHYFERSRKGNCPSDRESYYLGRYDGYMALLERAIGKLVLDKDAEVGQRLEMPVVDCARRRLERVKMEFERELPGLDAKPRPSNYLMRVIGFFDSLCDRDSPEAAELDYLNGEARKIWLNYLVASEVMGYHAPNGKWHEEYLEVMGYMHQVFVIAEKKWASTGK